MYCLCAIDLSDSLHSRMFLGLDTRCIIDALGHFDALCIFKVDGYIL